jgi:hypothetical protein
MELTYIFLSTLPTYKDAVSDEKLQIMQNIQSTAIRQLVRGAASSSSSSCIVTNFARRILLSIVLLYHKYIPLSRPFDELVQALLSSIDRSQIATTPGQRKIVYETLNQKKRVMM